MFYNTWLLVHNFNTSTLTILHFLLKNGSTSNSLKSYDDKQNLTFMVISYEIYETCQISYEMTSRVRSSIFQTCPTDILIVRIRKLPLDSMISTTGQ